MYLNHWSASRVPQLEPREYNQGNYFKPCGFWFDCDRDWMRWCTSEQYNLRGLYWAHSVHIVKTGALYLDNADEIDKFHVKYSCPLAGAAAPHPATDIIDWPRVCHDYPGIIIAPYCWPRRMTYIWYYGWDCASGCVWDLSLLRLGKPRPGIRNSRIAKTKKK